MQSSTTVEKNDTLLLLGNEKDPKCPCEVNQRVWVTNDCEMKRVIVFALREDKLNNDQENYTKVVVIFHSLISVLQKKDVQAENAKYLAWASWKEQNYKTKLNYNSDFLSLKNTGCHLIYPS